MSLLQTCHSRFSRRHDCSNRCEAVRIAAANRLEMLVCATGTLLAPERRLPPALGGSTERVMSRERKPADVGGTHGRPHRMMAVWTAGHDNGWVTSVVENPNGSFAAWAAPDGQGGGVYSILDEAEEGKRAATASLRRDAGHTDCHWSLHRLVAEDLRRVRPPARRGSAREDSRHRRPQETGTRAPDRVSFFNKRIGVQENVSGN